VYKYGVRAEVAENMGSEVMMFPEEIEALKKASRIVGGAVHPETNEIIPLPMRMSGFVSFNVPILALMLFAPNQTPAFNACMQMLNQTYNAGLNYGNRNTSADYTSKDLAKGYLGALASSMGIAYGLRTALAPQIAQLKGSKALIASAVLNSISAATAGGLNCALMRSKEL
jgi:hypothetical protein